MKYNGPTINRLIEYKSMDHMRVSGMETSSVILSRIKC